MTGILQCYSCGATLEALSLPLSRQDQCPSCSRYLHVCRLCEFYDPQVPRQCREDDAEEVMDKEKVNFCDWFKAAPGRFDDTAAAADRKAGQALAALFGDAADGAGDDDDDADRKAADDLFR